MRTITISSKNEGKKKFKHPLSLPGETFYKRYGSEEEIVQDENKPAKEARQSVKAADDILVTTSWQVRSKETDTTERDEEMRRAVHGYKSGV
jgi:hypothetical protein